ncbi:hypothetical protein N7468_000819 [Penicillium chermesinum]|uniref:Uncharacterized protein n=1 Tax=Penicillium chermesinum TaxID=63820 RepID=A0A9W9PFF6_9EURO|nr:uncharacterized protein N7468_000819 [Penicillium chermesinum]KAJ5245836.1 hypothetical protein N7468_000819 [Penicillium chermesinum]
MNSLNFLAQAGNTHSGLESSRAGIRTPSAECLIGPTSRANLGPSICLFHPGHQAAHLALYVPQIQIIPNPANRQRSPESSLDALESTMGEFQPIDWRHFRQILLQRHGDRKSLIHGGGGVLA